MGIKKAFIKDDKGKKICDFKDNNLHVLGYSSKINKFLKYESLIKNIYFLKKNQIQSLIGHRIINENGVFLYHLINSKN